MIDSLIKGPAAGTSKMILFTKMSSAIRGAHCNYEYPPMEAAVHFMKVSGE